MPQKMMRALGAGVEPRHLADGGGGDAAHRLHLLRREVLDLGLQALEALGVGLHVLDVDHALRDDDVEHGVEQRHVAARLELQDVAGVAGDALVLPARVHDDQLGAALGRVLEERGGDGMVLGRPRADDDDAVAVLGGRERRRHGAGVQPLHQRRDGGGVAQPRAVIDVVGAEALPDQLLEQVGLLVGALGRAEAGDRLAAVARCGSPSGPTRPWPSASSQVASRKYLPISSRRICMLASLATPSRRISGFFRRSG